MTATNWSDDAAVGGVVLNVRDVTEQRAAEERLQQEALQDSLTGLANRRWFMRALDEAVGRSGRTGAPFGVLVLDVDDFKRVNDTLGHPAGDALLVDLARRLISALRPADTAARLGGDEFVVIAEDLRSPDDALTVARRVLERCTGPYELAGVDAPVRRLGVDRGGDQRGPGRPPDAGARRRRARAGRVGGVGRVARGGPGAGGSGAGPGRRCSTGPTPRCTGPSGSAATASSRRARRAVRTPDPGAGSASRVGPRVTPYRDRRPSAG